MSVGEVRSKSEDAKEKTIETQSSAKEQLKDASQQTGQSLDAVRQQLLSYGKQLQDYLKNVEARVEDYRFSIAKKENGLSVDVAFKATVQARS